MAADFVQERQDVAMNYFPERVERFRFRLEENRQELPFFLLFLLLCKL